MRQIYFFPAALLYLVLGCGSVNESGLLDQKLHPGTLKVLDYSFFERDLNFVFGEHSSWQGTANFTVSSGNFAHHKIVVKDGKGETWSVTSPTSFGVATPAQISVKTYEREQIREVQIRDISVRPTSIANKVLYSRHPRKTQSSKIWTIGPDLKGLQVSFRVKSRFYRNHVEPACSRIVLQSRSGAKVVLDHRSVATKVEKLVAPIQVLDHPKCQSTRLRSPESKKNDVKMEFYEFALSNKSTTK